MKDLNVRPETINFQRKTQTGHSDINHSNILYDPPPRVMEIKAKTNKQALIKLKSFCTKKETIRKMKRQPSEWRLVALLNRHFSKENIQMANKHMKRCSTSLIIREMQIQTTMRYHFTPVRMAAIQKSVSNKCWRGCGAKGNPLTLLIGMQSSTATMENSVEIS